MPCKLANSLRAIVLLIAYFVIANQLVAQSGEGALQIPIFSQDAGWVSPNTEVSLTHPSQDVTLIYTIDGSTPSLDHIGGQSYSYYNQYRETVIHSNGSLLKGEFESQLYQKPIKLDNLFDRANKISEISSTYHYQPDYLPRYSVPKVVTIRAAAYLNGLYSDVVTYTYFQQDSEIPQTNAKLIALSIDDDKLFDVEKGVYVAGRDFIDWRKEDLLTPASPTSPANYNRRGKEYESVLTLEFYDAVTGQKELEQNLGFRIQGQSTRVQPQKSLKLYARKEYGKARIKYPLFQQDTLHEYKRIVLRSVNTYRISDAFYSAMVSHLPIDQSAYEPAIVYINGEYYGLFDLREKLGKHYIEKKYGVDRDQIDLLYNKNKVDEGDAEHYLAILGFVDRNPMQDERNFKEVEKVIDTDNLIDYQVAQNFSGNTDWPHKNIDYWRARVDYKSNAPYGQDGKWRWILSDLDYAFGLVDKFDCTINNFDRAIGQGQEWYQTLLYNLLENDNFKNRFINRYADLLNTSFQRDRLQAILQERVIAIEPFISQHVKRWRVGSTFPKRVETIQDFISCRGDEVFSQLKSFFKAGNMYKVELDIADRDQPNYIKINSIELNENTVGVNAHPYPWQGLYFENVPITVSAVAVRGYVFSHWEGMPEGTPQTFTTSPQSNLKPIAHFREALYPQFLAQYQSSSGGYLVGEKEQLIEQFSSATPVHAIPDEGYEFMGWSDGSTQNPRIDTNVQQDITVQAIFETISAIELQKQNIFVSPNPSHGEFSVNLLDWDKSVARYKVYNLHGSLLKEGKVPDSHFTLDIFSFQSGSYMLVVEYKKGKWKTVKLIKR